MSEEQKATAEEEVVDVTVEEAAEGEVVDATEDTDEAPSAEEFAALQGRLAEVEKALSEADIRAQAEVQNARRRAENDVSKARKFALEKFAGDIISVADNLERALSALPAEDAAAREGIELTLKELLKVFEQHGITRIDPTGETFNPELHEAMTMIPMPGAEPNSVVEVLEKGYVLNERLLRPARVVVAKGE